MFKSLSLQNFKCFKALEKPVEFSQINIVTGSNGRGKSSIFQSVLLLAQSYEAGKDWLSLKIKGKFIDLGNYRDVVRNGDINEKMTIVVETDNEKDNRMKFIGKNTDGKGIDCTFDNIYVNDVPLIDLVVMVGDDKLQNEDHVLSTVSTSTYGCFSQFANVYYVAADRQGPASIWSEPKENSLVGDALGIHGERIINSLYENKEEFQEMVAKELSYILGGASVKAKDTDDFEAVRLYLDSIDESNGYKPINVGFGYSYVLPVVVLPLLMKEGSKFFVENPEAHLHPGAQSRLMQYLVRIAKEKNIQLFVESHSDHVVNAARILVKNKQNGIDKKDVMIIHIGRDQDKTPKIWQIKLDTEGNLSDYPQDFMEEWGNQMSLLV